ncbi:MAG: hypothetical protein ACK6DZ_25640 [Acidobacteriota bacterium]|jgi:hypothetical protein
MVRFIARSVLVVVLLSCFGLIIHLLSLPKDKDMLATLTATLAVIAAVISAFPALRVLELQEDATRPNPILYFDVSSRYLLMLLKLKNIGAAVAYDITINWETRPINADGKEITALDKVAVLVPQQCVSVNVGLANQLYTTRDSMTFVGSLSYRDASGKQYSTPFTCSADHFDSQLDFDEELPKTLHELQKLPESLGKIQQAILRGDKKS